MHGLIPADAQAAIFPADSSDSEFLFTDSSDSRWFSGLAKRLWPSKTGASLEFLTGRKERQCYRYASGDAEPMASFLADLLRSEDGQRVLDELMRGSNAAWWKQVQFALAAMPHVERLRQLDLPLK
jgi:hypothetical protein